MIAEEEKRLEEFKQQWDKSRVSNDESEFKLINDMDTVINVDGTHVPPQHDERTFNVNNITGKFETDL